MRNKSGFTLVELLAVIVVLAIILAVAIPTISGIITSSTKGAMGSDAKMLLQAIKYKLLEDDTFDPTTITEENIATDLKLPADNYSDLVITKEGNDYRIVVIGQNRWDGYTAYGTIKNMTVINTEDYDIIPPVITLIGSETVFVDVGDTYTDAGATAIDEHDGDITEDIVVTGTVDINTIGSYTLIYNVSDDMGNAAEPVTRTVNVISPYNADKGVNRPKLATGMTPIKWDGSAWIETTADDDAWYSYTVGDKKWANAKTADGSMWVWIPRYVYRISSNWHTATAGIISIQFSMGTDDTRGGTVTLDTGTTAAASNGNYTNHPAFTFSTAELLGIWVAKFEASVSNTDHLCYTTPSSTNCNVDNILPKIVPNVSSWRYIKIGNMFTVTRNMETSNTYGWGTSGSGIDTHMMKNVEWGAVTYLGKSSYGKINEIFINNSSPSITGCAGTTVSEASYSGCQNAYDTTNGYQASTTNNIYGVYDMSGGVAEYVAAYVNNGNAYLTFYGDTIINADNKYKDIYIIGASDDRQLNYEANMKKGDAVYETSSNGDDSHYSWFADYNYFALTSYPFLGRGGPWSLTTGAGAFHYWGVNGSESVSYGFRPTLLVGTGL